MKNFVQRGETITIPAPGAVASGDVVIVGEIHGIAAGDAADGTPCDVVTVGCFTLPKIAANSFTLGAPVYWDGTNKLATSVASGNTRIGTAIEAAAASTATVVVKLV